jgi:aspartyl aminopeptidase
MGFATEDVAAGLIDYLHASPSPFHAVASSARLLAAAGFTGVTPHAPLPSAPGRYYLARGGSLVAWSTEFGPAPTAGFRVVGAHTDSPNLRIKPQPDLARAGFAQLGVEVYGGPLLNSWLDRDLGLSGRVSVRAAALAGSRFNEKSSGAMGLGSAGGTEYDASLAVARPVDRSDPAGVTTVLIHIDEPLLRVAQLAIHLDRAVNTDGVRLNPQQHLAPIWGLGSAGDFPGFTAFVADRIGVAPGDVLAWDIMTHDVQAPARIGAQREFIVGGRMDNLATSYAGTRALIGATSDRAASGAANGAAGGAAGSGAASYPIPLLVLFDHEEVGSVSERGAASPLLPTTLERIVASLGGSRDDFHRAMAATIIASGDMAHATHPNYLDKHEPEHRIAIDGGPVLKVNNQLRYATGAPGVAAFALACEQAEVPMQRFVTRSDLPCGSTIGPITAAQTGCETVDFGAAMLSMHSAREMVGAADQARYAAALQAFLAPAVG